MGLDISLIQIVKESQENCWLSVEESPELTRVFPQFETVLKIPLQENPNYEEKGFYYKEIAYQRKGVTASFYNQYKADETIVKKQDLKQLLEHIEENKKEEFKENFIKPFKENVHAIIMGY